MDDADTHISIAYVDGVPAGYFELHHAGSEVEIHFLGLLPERIGNGYGGHLLNEAVRLAWKLGPQRAWLETCSWDGPNAVANYEARGLRLYDEKVAMEEIPAYDAQHERGRGA
jgi:GNAT superfamily N-acetyltransferase